MTERNDVPDYTPVEQQLFARLPREREPDGALEQRVVDELTQQGLLRPSRTTRFIPVRLAIAAGILLFLFGWVAGAIIGLGDRSPGVREAETKASEPPSDIRMVFWL